MELRCSGNKLHGIVVTKSSGEIEFRCDSRYCGRTPEIVVLHRFNLSTGEYKTKKYSEPIHTERKVNGSGN